MCTKQLKPCPDIHIIMSDGTNQRIGDKFVSKNLGPPQGYLVSYALKAEWFSWDDVSNIPDYEIGEVASWHLVTDEVTERKLLEADETMLINDFGTWWGRYSSGAASDEGVWVRWMWEAEILKGQRNEWKI